MAVLRGLPTLPEAAEIVALIPFLVTPIRDVNDTVVIQTAIIACPRRVE
jgi:hypothetical protein